MRMMRHVTRSLVCACAFLVLGAVSGTSLAENPLGLDDGRSRGSHAAPVVLIEYSDFTCGYCVKFFRETWPRLREKYVDTGKVRFVYRDYPRASHGIGVEAALAARCAGDQGQYWAMHDRMLMGGRLSENLFDQYARAIGLDTATFAKCRRDRPYEDAIFRDKAEGLEWGFRGTPGFILMKMDGGRSNLGQDPPIGLPGAFPFEVFEEQIEGLLAKGASPQRG